MKVYIGPYKDYFGPYQLADLLQKVGVSEDRCNTVGDWLSKTWVNKVFTWIYSKKKRKIKINIHKYDTWGMDSTLALIILPMLKQLKDTKHGSGIVDLDDVPEKMRFTTTENYECQETFDFYNDPDLCKQNIQCDVHDRWDWVLEEMIWAFEQLNIDWADQYWLVKPELDLEDYPEDEGKETIPIRWKVKGECDWEGTKKHQDRIDNGLRLFGKYYQSLWD